MLLCGPRLGGCLPGPVRFLTPSRDQPTLELKRGLGNSVSLCPLAPATFFCYGKGTRTWLVLRREFVSGAYERTLVLVKPDGAARGLTGEIIARFERKGLSLVGLKLITVDRAKAERHYAEHADKPFYPALVDFITSGPVVVMCLEGHGAISVVRGLAGPTSGLLAPGGTIRGDFGLSGRRNLVHAADSPEAAAREIALWFTDAELLSPGAGTGSAAAAWVCGADERRK